MTTDLHSAVRTAVDEARRLATEATPGPWYPRADAAMVPHLKDWVVADSAGIVPVSWPYEQPLIWRGVLATDDANFIAAWNPSHALAMCDWADDVLARHAPVEYADVTLHVCNWCKAPDGAFSEIDWPCAEVKSVAAAFGVETGETE